MQPLSPCPYGGGGGGGVVKSASVNTKTYPEMAADGPSGTEPDFQMDRPQSWRKNPCN